MYLNDVESDESYSNKKYWKWVRHGFRSPQEKDPTFLSCSFCGRRTYDLKIISLGGRDHLTCKRHPYYKGDSHEA